jgi:hypothetical protein
MRPALSRAEGCLVFGRGGHLTGAGSLRGPAMCARAAFSEAADATKEAGAGDGGAVVGGPSQEGCGGKRKGDPFTGKRPAAWPPKAGPHSNAAELRLQEASGVSRPGTQRKLTLALLTPPLILRPSGAEFSRFLNERLGATHNLPTLGCGCGRS